MLRLLAYLISKGVSTTNIPPEFLEEGVTGLPSVTANSCAADCNTCIDICPTDAIIRSTDGTSVVVDRGRCIGCNYCVRECPSQTLINDRSTSTWAKDRLQLLISRPDTELATKATPDSGTTTGAAGSNSPAHKNIFQKSIAIRVVSTGCSACDLEISAANNPIFDMERFGVQVVASPRFADALLITGPVPKAMHEPLLSCYKAMANPKLVIACGTCAISGGVHAGGYAEANGVSAILPVDVFIPGCPPHPWQIIQAVLGARR
jgi:Ni,Fe-hydrogenase III small subunit/formate hydrogenlyase subunit 6/NADH:ubiquinone oxidoreductase subunit I